MEILDGCTHESDRNYPIGTSRCIVLRDVHIPTKPDMSGHAAKQVAFSIRNKIKEVINPEELTKMIELDFNKNYRNSKPMSDDNKPFWAMVKKGIYIMHMICHCHTKIICPIFQTTRKWHFND